MMPKECSGGCKTIDRRALLTRTVPACAVACLGLGKIEGLSTTVLTGKLQGQHKFDVPQEISLSPRQRGQLAIGGALELIGVFRDELGDEESIRILNQFSAERGRQSARRQLAGAPDNSFQSFVQIFRSPTMESSLTLDIVEDTENVFALEVRECLWAELFRDAGMDGEIGHAAVCNMDYFWPTEFNPAFKMERDKTLMQGHDICNHRYINTA